MNLNKTAENLLNNLFISRLSFSYTYKKIIAFTLAEVLITLLIIGIVASLAIPALIADTQQAEYITAWKKAYGIISQAQLNMIRDYGSVSEVFSNIYYTTEGGNNFMNGWLPYLSVIKKCIPGRIISDGCQTENFKTLDGNTILYYNIQPYTSGIVLNAGTFIGFYPGICSGSLCSDSNLFIDINGSKEPNVMGKDVFRMSYLPQKGRFIPGIGGSDCTGAGWNCGAYYLTQ